MKAQRWKVKAQGSRLKVENECPYLYITLSEFSCPEFFCFCCPENVFLGRTSCKAVGCDCPCALFPAVADFDALGSVLKNFKRRKTGDVASFTPALFYGTDGGYTHAGN